MPRLRSGRGSARLIGARDRLALRIDVCSHRRLHGALCRGLRMEALLQHSSAHAPMHAEALGMSVSPLCACDVCRCAIMHILASSYSVATTTTTPDLGM